MWRAPRQGESPDVSGIKKASANRGEIYAELNVFLNWHCPHSQRRGRATPMGRHREFNQ